MSELLEIVEGGCFSATDLDVGDGTARLEIDCGSLRIETTDASRKHSHKISGFKQLAVLQKRSALGKPGLLKKTDGQSTKQLERARDTVLLELLATREQGEKGAQAAPASGGTQVRSL